MMLHTRFLNRSGYTPCGVGEPRLASCRFQPWCGAMRGLHWLTLIGCAYTAVMLVPNMRNSDSEHQLFPAVAVPPLPEAGWLGQAGGEWPGGHGFGVGSPQAGAGQPAGEGVGPGHRTASQPSSRVGGGTGRAGAEAGAGLGAPTLTEGASQGAGLPLVYSVVEARGAVSFEGLRRGGGRVAGFNYAEGVRGAGDALQQPGRAVCNASEWPDLGANYTEPMRYLGNCSWELQRHEDLGQRAEKHTPQTHIATFLRTTLTDGAELDIPYAEHTESLFQRDAAAGGLLARVFGSKKIRWSQKFRGCRLCGYSCSGLKTVPRTHAFPLLRRGPVEVIHSALQKADRPQHLILFHGVAEHLEAPKVAHAMGWLVGISPRGRDMRKACHATVDTVTFFFKRRNMVALSQSNVGHWIHDTLFPMFMTIYNHVGDPARAKFNVVPDEGDATTSLWRQFWAVGDIGEALLSTLVPARSRIRLRLGMCFKEAVFDCPKADSMGPIVPFQRWLQRTRSMSFVPLPLAPALNLMLLVRCKGGSRYLANWEELRAEASGMGYAVTLPPAVPVFKQMLSLVKHLQRTHVLASAHGSELAPMLFMPNGSVVVEIVPREYRYLDAWYVRQARAAGLHLLRVMPNSTDVVYHRYGEDSPPVCGRSFARTERDVAEQPSLESGYRKLASSITVPLPTWHTVLTLAKELLFKHSLLGINATSEGSATVPVPT